jgi:carbamoyl-phosphate synthase large subunit
MNVLLLGAGGPACHGAIKSLRDIDFDGKIVSVDCNPLSAGFYLSDSYYIVPKASDDTYIDELLKVVEKENIDIILPTSFSEIVTITKNSDRFNGVNLFMSNYESIMICSDKLKFYEKCKENFPFPKSTDKFIPVFAKPRDGKGSRGIKLIDDFEENYIYQEYLPGTEYTIDVLSDMNSEVLSVIPRVRLQTKAGISTKGKIVRNEVIEKECSDIVKFLNLKGVVCVQMKEDKDGNPKFIEINPRFGGGTFFTTLAGVNFVKIILDIVEGKEVEVPEPKEITVLRYFDEVVC